MYKEFYGFESFPFNITPNPRFLFLSGTHLDALQHLRYGVEQRKGFIALVGEVGCGKTTLCRRLLEELDSEVYETALILNPSLSEEQLLRAILTELGETVESNAKVDLLDQLNRVLLARIEAGKEIVLIIDEAQNLSLELLEQIRMLSNLETDEQKLLQIILMGQPELSEKLARKELRQLRQRILVYYELGKLNLPELEHYIHHRLTLAGGRGRPRFTRWAIKSIHRRSGGVPRLINNLCDKALLAAFVRGSDQVTWWDVRRARKEL
ncbi:MAG: AAA family ATPase [Opitutales bacterium]|nr:AAA family ATPase [Opitutales bacterium]